MYKMPIGLKISIFVLLFGLQTGIYNLILALKGNLIFTVPEFQIIFFIVAGVGTLLGIFFINIFRSWTPEMMIDKMDNVIKINNLILALQQRKFDLKSEIPDYVKVTIEQKGK